MAHLHFSQQLHLLIEDSVTCMPGREKLMFARSAISHRVLEGPVLRVLPALFDFSWHAVCFPGGNLT